MLLDDIIAFKDHALAADLDVTLQVWRGMVHAFQGFSLFLPEARDAIAAIGEWVDDRLAETSHVRAIARPLAERRPTIE